MLDAACYRPAMASQRAAFDPAGSNRGAFPQPEPRSDKSTFRDGRHIQRRPSAPDWGQLNNRSTSAGLPNPRTADVRNPPEPALWRVFLIHHFPHPSCGRRHSARVTSTGALRYAPIDHDPDQAVLGLRSTLLFEHDLYSDNPFPPGSSFGAGFFGIMC